MGQTSMLEKMPQLHRYRQVLCIRRGLLDPSHPSIFWMNAIISSVTPGKGVIVPAMLDLPTASIRKVGRLSLFFRWWARKDIVGCIG